MNRKEQASGATYLQSIKSPDDNENSGLNFNLI